MHATPDTLETTVVWINARFLDRPVTGVERVAFELINVLATEHVDREGCWYEGTRRFRLQLIAPASGSAISPWPNLTLHRRGRFSGHAWEQLDLPRLTFGQCLVSLCNTGPLLKRRHILYLHDAQPFAIPHNFSLSFRLWYRIVFHVAGRSARYLLVNSRFTQRELARHVGLARDKMTLVSLGSEHVLREKTSANVLERFNLPEGPFVLAVASANPNKNFAGVLRAIEHLGQDAPPCVIVGQTNQKQFSDVTMPAGGVTHLGYVSDRELLALYRRALCLAFPSFYEGFGLPPLEAMAVGCPVIASHTSAMPEIGGRAVDYCDPDDYRSLAKAIEQVAADSNGRARMRRQGIRRSAGFSWAHSGATLRRLIGAEGLAAEQAG